jgi:hypothetical protein
MTIVALARIRYFNHISAFAADIDVSGEPKGFVLDHPRPLNAFGAAGADEFDFYLLDSGVHDHRNAFEESKSLTRTGSPPRGSKECGTETRDPSVSAGSQCRKTAMILFHPSAF